MAQQEGRSVYKRRTSYLPSVISISLVLFMLGIFGVLIISAKRLSEHIKENIQLTIFFKDAIPESDILRFQKTLETEPYVKSLKYVSSQEAAEQFAREMGHDFVKFLGYNPLLPSLEVNINSAYAVNDSIDMIEASLIRQPGIKEVLYQKSILEQINKNVRVIGVVILVISILFFLIAITLINNTIRLNLYARRFLIKSMQLVGATRGFIIKPFLFKSLIHGFYGSLIACILLASLLYSIPRWMPDIQSLYNYEEFAILFLGLFLLGFLITLLSSYFATKRYLRLKIDDLY